MGLVETIISLIVMLTPFEEKSFLIVPKRLQANTKKINHLLYENNEKFIRQHTGLNLRRVHNLFWSNLRNCPTFFSDRIYDPIS